MTSAGTRTVEPFGPGTVGRGGRIADRACHDATSAGVVQFEGTIVRSCEAHDITKFNHAAMLNVTIATHLSKQARQTRDSRQVICAAG